MLVTCKLENIVGQPCHYNVDGYCTARTININEKGMCEYIMIRDHINPDMFQPIANEYKDLDAVPVVDDRTEVIVDEWLPTQVCKTRAKRTNNRKMMVRKIARPHR